MTLSKRERKHLSDWERESRRGDRIFWSSLFGGIFMLVCLSAVIAWNFDTKPKYQTVKPAVERLGCNASEDVIGQAVQLNTSLVVWHWFGIGTDYELIEIPECK